MIKIDEIKSNVSLLLDDRGLTTSRKEPMVRQLLYHLYVAMDIYRYMTVAERNKAGFWYRAFKGSYRLAGFLKERKRNREKEKSPLHPSYKEKETEVKEKEEKQTEQNTATGDVVLEGFRKECLRHVGRYGQELVEDFYYHWKQVDKKTGKRLFEGKRCCMVEKRIYVIQGDRRPSSGACEGKGRREAAGCKHRRPAGHCRQTRAGQCEAGAGNGAKQAEPNADRRIPGKEPEWFPGAGGKGKAGSGKEEGEQDMNKSFEIRAYGKSELAMIYFPHSSQDTAMKKLRRWFKINPRLRHLVNRDIEDFTPKQVRLIVREVGEPFEI